MRRGWVWIFIAGCSSTPPDRLQDGGGFSIPDAGMLDATIRDSGAPDTGPFACEPACAAPDVCGCVGLPTPTCGCAPAGTYQASCDPLHLETCASPFQCVASRVQDDTLALCSDGREGSYCSHAGDVCSTAIGCVCLTSPTGLTECTCVEDVAPDVMLCDRMVPASCPGGTCVRTVGTAGTIWFYCSHGALGEACETTNDTCRTTLGCTCPRIQGREICTCGEPGTMEGDPCDVNVGGSCVAPLICRVNPDQLNGASTICTTRIPGSDAGTEECDPGDPSTCPPGWNCVPIGGRLECRPP